MLLIRQCPDRAMTAAGDVGRGKAKPVHRNLTYSLCLCVSGLGSAENCSLRRFKPEARARPVPATHLQLEVAGLHPALKATVVTAWKPLTPRSQVAT